MIELWLVVSTVCFWGQSCADSVAFVYENDRPRNVIVAESPYCIQQVHVSTFQPVLRGGDTVYKVMPDGDESEKTANTEFHKLLCEIGKHDWRSPLIRVRCAVLHAPGEICNYGNYQECSWCKKKRHKVTEERWILE